MEVCRCSIVSVKLTRLSGKVALALNGTGRAGATSGGLVKNANVVPATFMEIRRWFKQNGVKNRPVFPG